MKNQREAAYEFIERKILSGALKPGDRLSERGLALEIGLSRTPLREALQSFLTEGILVRQDDGTLQMKQSSSEEIIEVYEARLAIESKQAELAADRITASQLEFMAECCRKHRRLIEKIESGAIQPEDYSLCSYVAMSEVEQPFHNTIGDAAGNRLLVRMTRQLRLLTRSWIPLSTVRCLGRELSTADYRRIHAEHEEIINALKAHDAQAARQAAAWHVENALSILKGYMDRQKQSETGTESIQQKIARINDWIK